MKIIEQQVLTGERALFKSKNLDIKNSNFLDGESPLKESNNINISYSVFGWKYPLWYCKNINVDNTTLLETARSGIWYTDNISIRNSIIDAPKTFRKSNKISLIDVNLTNALETLWGCEDISLENVNAKGDYFSMNSENIIINNLNLSGNYAFDSCKNIEVHNSKIISKDAFWNCENVKVYNSTIIGEYLGWNSKNITFIDCFIQSEQGLCYIDNLVIKNCKIVKTDLAFEYSSVKADITTLIDSIKNPIKAEIYSSGIGEVIIDDKNTNLNNIKIYSNNMERKNAI